MPESTMLLISRDEPLIKSCREIVTSTAHLQLDVEAEIADFEPYAERDDIALLLVHLVEETDLEPACRLLRRLAAAKQATATIVIGETHHAEEGLRLLRAGAADYLSRPLDLGRLSYLIDSLTLRARYQPKSVAVESAALAAMPGEPFFYAPCSMMSRIIEQVRIVAPQEATILLEGETG